MPDLSKIDSTGVTNPFGIGVAVPSYPLHVLSSAGASGTLSLSGQVVNGTGGPSYIIMGNTDSAGTGGPNVVVAANRSLTFGVGTSFTAAGGGTLTTHMQIGPTGYMLRPKQPAFMVYGTGGSTTYADAAEFNIGTGVHYDATNSYSTATGRYTAPVAGFYSFSYGAYTYVGGQMSFKKNGVTWAPSDSIGLCSAAVSEIRGTSLYISLAAGDYVSYGWRSGYSGAIYHSHSWFSGHLVG